MPYAVPSQVRDLIRMVFPELEKEQHQPGQRGIYRAGDIRAVLDLLDRVPDELIRLSGDDFARFWANVSALRNAWEDRNTTNNQINVAPLSGSGFRPLYEINRLLANCPDEAPGPVSTVTFLEGFWPLYGQVS